MEDFAYNYNTNVLYYPTSTVSTDFSNTVFMITLLIILVMLAVSIVSMWKIFKKAGRQGWASIVPVYNSWVLFEVGGLEGALSLICLIFTPFSLYGWYKVCKAFGKSTGFFVALIFFPLICMPILAFGESEYILGNNNQNGAGGQNPEPVQNNVPPVDGQNVNGNQ